MPGPIDAPNLNMGVDELVDWLELSALFDSYGVVRIDSLDSSLDELASEPEDDIAERDRALEKRRDAIENEIDLRASQLGPTYPFRLGEDGEEVSVVPHWRDEQYAFYLVCLITSHTTGSAFLNAPPSGDLLTALRNRVFQVIATLAMSGLSGGPAISVGWPRIRGEAITSLLQRAEALGAGLTPRIPPGPYTPPAEKDGGIDVISWSSEPAPPPTNFYFAQAASGRNWENKPVSNHATVFRNNYIADLMTGNRSHATLIPFRVIDQTLWNGQHLMHRAILERLRLPARAYAGLLQARGGMAVDEADQVATVVDWLESYLAFAIA